MAYGIKITLTHNGTTTEDVIVRPPYVKIPVNGSVELIFDDQIARSYETGAIREALDNVLITASFGVGTSFTEAVGGGSLNLGPYSIYYADGDGVFFEGENINNGDYPDDMLFYASDFIGSAGSDPNNLNNTATGGYIYQYAGDSFWGSGGRLRFYAGDGNDGDGGYVRIYGGDSYLNYYTTADGYSYDAGYVRIRGGYSSSGWGGDVEIYGGDGGTYGGDIYIASGYSNNIYPDYNEGAYGQSGSIDIRIENYGSDFARSGDINIAINSSPNGSDGGSLYLNAGDSGYSSTPPIEGGVVSSQGGGGVYITAGDAWGYGVDGNHGGPIEIYAGDGTNDWGQGQGNGGDLLFSAGNARAYGQGGDVDLYAGNGTGRPTEEGGPTDGTGGDVTIYAGDCYGSGTDSTGSGGQLDFSAGDTWSTGSGGAVTIYAGSAYGRGHGGDVEIYAGYGNHSNAAFSGRGGDIYLSTGSSEAAAGGDNGRGGDLNINLGNSTNSRAGHISVSTFGTGIVTSNSGVLSASNNSTGQGSVAIANGANNEAFTVTIEVVPAVGYMFMFTCQAGHTAVSVQSSYFIIDDGTGKPVVKGTASNSDTSIRNIYINWMVVPFFVS